MIRFWLLLLLLVTSYWSLAQKNLKYQLNYISADVQYTPDERFYAVTSGNEVLFYTTGTKTFVKKFKVGKNPITSLTFLDDENQMIIGFQNEQVVLYDHSASKVNQVWSVKKLLNGTGFKNFAAAITEDSLLVYNFETKKVVFKKKDHLKPMRALAVSKKANLIATGGGDGFVNVYNIDGSLAWKKKLHDGWIRSLAFSPDGRYLASGGDNGKVIVSDNAGENIYSSDVSTGWVRSLQFSGDGKYLASGDERGHCLVHWIEKKLITHRMQLGDPLLAIRFKSDGTELAVVEDVRGTKFWNITEWNISPLVLELKDEKDLTPPQILISNPPNIQAERLRSSQDLIQIKGIAVDESGLRNLRINNIEIPLKENGNFILNLPLTMGDNFITVEARDVNDNIAIKKFVITRKNLDGEDYNPTKAKNYLFVIGVNDYTSWPKLNNAVKDATDITSCLMQNYKFDLNNVVLIKNEQATRNNIFSSLRGLIEQITPQDNLVIYYSGHGYFDELLNEGYWVPVDASVNSPGDYLSNSDLLKIVGNINSQHTLLIADACFSGALFSEAKRGYTENVERFKSRWGLASGRLEVVSDGIEGQNSPFTSTVIEFLETNAKEKFAVSEMIYYVKLKVAEKSNQTPIGNPLKSAGDEGGEFVFYKK